LKSCCQACRLSSCVARSTIACDTCAPTRTEPSLPKLTVPREANVNASESEDQGAASTARATLRGRLEPCRKFLQGFCLAISVPAADRAAQLWALEESFLSTLGRQHRRLLPRCVARRVSVADAGHRRIPHLRRDGRLHPPPLRRDWPLPALDQRRQIEWQGRVARHRLASAWLGSNALAVPGSVGVYLFRFLTGTSADAS
jgi:hypothetical protein